MLAWCGNARTSLLFLKFSCWVSAFDCCCFVSSDARSSWPVSAVRCFWLFLYVSFVVKPFSINFHFRSWSFCGTWSVAYCFLFHLLLMVLCPARNRAFGIISCTAIVCCSLPFLCCWWLLLFLFCILCFLGAAVWLLPLRLLDSLCNQVLPPRLLGAPLMHLGLLSWRVFVFPFCAIWSSGRVLLWVLEVRLWLLFCMLCHHALHLVI